MKKIIVSQSIIYDKKTKTFKDTLDYRLIKFLYKNNIVAYPFPNYDLNEKLIYKIIDNYFRKDNFLGFILSGGNDIGEFKKRDKTENSIIKFCKKKKLPILGICRGMQMLSHHYGGTLRKIKNHVRTRHEIFSLINKKKIIVNSYHNWVIKKCPKVFNKCFFTKDGSLESIKHKTLPIEGWMWHPEREAKYSKYDIQNFKKLFKIS